MSFPSGEQWTIRHGDQEVTVVEVGGGLRTYTIGGVDVLHGYAADARADGGRGQVLMPWPSRIGDGKYTFDGVDQQLPITEVPNHNAIHGLVRWAMWTVRQRSDSSVSVAHRLFPQPGWPGSLDLQITYALGADGLSVTPSVTNLGAASAPFGYGAHPYLTVGEAKVDEVTLTVPAHTRINLDDRLLPVDAAPVSGAADFRTPRQIRDTVLDNTYTDLAATDGVWRARLEHGGRSTAMWAQAEVFGYAQVFSGDTLPPGRARCSGLAVEPMSCPGGAFASGDSLIVLEPGQVWTGTWGITATLPT
ncbi:aldose 1-epimerase family protein [Leekyejoonella antrihumi]|uniref:Galactose mutarotase n=1 Tax=Leekyejoonella antrihumi TaxID=1660198 RepID=A0A563E4X4_9MICO|nr:aldose 1-epimerase family protein [Leekyejoonella antrihumi]TWP37282.1 galactose mutarotase [Leekyejoonella antrihumi]